MPSKRYALEAGGPERLEVSWQGLWKSLSVRVDGKLLGSLADQKALKDGRDFPLEDGSTLRVQLVQVLLTPELRISRDGEPVPGSMADPEQRLAAAYGAIFFVAGVSVLLGMVAVVLRSELLGRMGLGGASILSGVVYGALGVFVRRRSRLALGLAIGLFVLDGAFFLAMAARAGGTPPVGAVMVRVFLTLAMLQGFPALKALGPVRPAEPVRRLGGPARRTASAGMAQPPAPSPGPSVPPASAARILSGEAERRRLELGQPAVHAAQPTGPAKMLRPAAGNRPVAGWGRDAAAEALRFVAHRCEIADAGLHVTLANVKTLDVAWSDVGAMVARQLPPDPPWDARILLDLVPAAVATGAAPVRILSTTFVNYAALPGGASTARLENMRRLAAHIASRHPSVGIDPETAAFLDGVKAPARFANMTQFAEYDARYG